MKDVGGKVEKQTDDFLTSREDLTFFYDDDDDGFSDAAFHSDISNGSIPDLTKSISSDAAFHSDISNGSIPDLTKSISSDVAVSCESNSLKNWTDKLSCRCAASSGTSCQPDWSSEQSIPYSDDRREFNQECNQECNQKCYSKDAVTQASIRRGPTIFKDCDADWSNVSGFYSVSPDLSISSNRHHDGDGYKQRHNNNICRNEQQCDGGLIRQPQRGGRRMHWSFTHESLRPNTQWQTIEDLECCDSETGSSDLESGVSESLWSPSPEDVPSIRPDFVPKLDLSWVFEDENRKKKRSEKRMAGRRRTKKVSEINGHAFAKSLTTSMSSDTSPVEETRSVKDKAKSLQFNECFGDVPCCIWQHRGQDEGAYVASAQYSLDHYDQKVDQTLAHKFRPHHHGSDNIRQAVSACAYDDEAPEKFDRTVWSAETGKEDEMFQMTRCQLPENTQCKPYFDGIRSEIRPRYEFQTSHNNSKNRSFNCRHLQKDATDCPSGIAVDDYMYEQPEWQEISKELAACSFHINGTNDQGLSDKYLTATKHLMEASHECAVVNRSQVPRLAQYYVVDEKRDSREIRQRSLVVQHETQEMQEIPDAIHQQTMLETNCCASDTYRLRRDDPPNIDLNFISSTTCISDSGLGVDTNSDLRISEFTKINAETTDSERIDAVRESEGEQKEEEKETKVKEEEGEEEHGGEEGGEGEEDQNMASNENLRSDELYDVEAAVIRPRRGRKQKLAKFVFCFIGCQTSCCKQTRCRPCYCDLKCDVKCFR